MTSRELRQKFLTFFERNGHTVIPSASLVPAEEEQLEGKEKVLFTSAGMQPLIPYLMGKSHPKGNKLADVQKCLRTDDIDEVGNEVHHTFFEMPGNWSLGAYWKSEAIELSFKFLTEELNIPLEKLAISVFAGDNDVSRDEESANKWKELGVQENRIAYLGKEHNWWPTNPAVFGPCGPDTEMFIWTGEGSVPEKFHPKDKRWVEVWNDVFMQFNRKTDGSLEDLPQKNVDTGMGLERTLAVLNGKDDDYKTDLFEPIFARIEEQTGIKYGENEKVTQDLRIVADHIKAATFLITDGIMPSNKLQGYVLRRLLRRSAVKLNQISQGSMEVLGKLVDPVIDIYKDTNYFQAGDWDTIRQVVVTEVQKFQQTLNKGLKEIEKIEKIDGKIAFDLYQSYGFPWELTEELFIQKGQQVDRKQFEEEFEKHRELSRTASAGKFKGGLAGHSETEIKYHTATHLLHQALRDILGPQVFQKGSNINSERLRFDFSYERKMTEEEINKAEDLVNSKIREDLKVDHKIVSLEEAKNLNAIGLFGEKYERQVSIYAIGPNYGIDLNAKDQRNRGGYYSLEFCGGPHVIHTGVIGGIRITKEKAISAGIRRIRAVLV
ncbi:hypothetical protein A3H40_03120 [Candidatus Daviesbacteria bacterium RIFCSPLOWO2_02_FULL_38_15]|uniref:alanine--tRNA ligase n=1 Tax=Candidatus Daviesbacteria bacterium RIFCSPLOWO2_02_FULL_38_15 TaxID=1797794 RepID=A0A1F5N1J4_9BACT|nr:MAG: hypothetical protein A3H40_03120 [Candidatus Daviesbacteria bacterium RIFCSPLOWO2_02_FULL_38_15]